MLDGLLDAIDDAFGLDGLDRLGLALELFDLLLDLFEGSCHESWEIGWDSPELTRFQLINTIGTLLANSASPKVIRAHSEFTFTQGSNFICVAVTLLTCPPIRMAVLSVSDFMNSDFDQMAHSRAQRDARRAFEEASQNDIDTARQALFRVQRSNRRNIDRYVRTKIFSAMLLAAAALIVIFCTRH
jgi:hypothetical protein